MAQIENGPSASAMENSALLLRVGLGIVFVIGGISKLSQLLDPARETKILESYWGSAGYVNQFFVDYLFSGSWPSEWLFLTSLSTFELVSGVCLIFGLAVRPLALIYGFLLWTFVMALPVVTTPGVEVTVKTFTSPALLVQVRDIALSGMMFTLFNLGPGSFSLDGKLFGHPAVRAGARWDNLGLLLRLSMAVPLLVGGFFAGMASIPTFATPAWILIPLGLVVLSGEGIRYAGFATMAVMLWYMGDKLNMDKSVIANLNGFKREFAFFAVGGVFAILGGGRLYKAIAGIDRIRAMFAKERPEQP